MMDSDVATRNVTKIIYNLKKEILLLIAPHVKNCAKTIQHVEELNVTMAIVPCGTLGHVERYKHRTYTTI